MNNIRCKWSFLVFYLDILETLPSDMFQLRWSLFDFLDLNFRFEFLGRFYHYTLFSLCLMILNSNDLSKLILGYLTKSKLVHSPTYFCYDGELYCFIRSSFRRFTKNLQFGVVLLDLDLLSLKRILLSLNFY